MMEYSVRRITDFSKIELLYHKRLKKDFAADELRSLGSLKHSWEDMLSLRAMEDTAF